MRLLGSQYLLEEELGGGANGTVWRGRHVGTNEPVAVKILRPELVGDPELVARFVRERLALLSVRGEHVLALRDHVVEAETLALVMPLIAGGDLRGLIGANDQPDFRCRKGGAERRLRRVAQQQRAIHDAWRRGAQGWERRQGSLREKTAPVAQWLVEAIAPQPGERILDLAAGPGETGFMIAERLGRPEP